MIEVKREEDEVVVRISGKEVGILDAETTSVLAECELADLAAEGAQPFPDGLELEIHSEDGFGTYLFHELNLSGHADGVSMAFRCHTPNKHWEGEFGLATFLAAVRDQASHLDNWQVTQVELEDDWKGITIERLISLGEPLVASVLSAAKELQALIHTAEVALSGLVWKDEYIEKEDSALRVFEWVILAVLAACRLRFSVGGIPRRGNRRLFSG